MNTAMRFTAIIVAFFSMNTQPTILQQPLGELKKPLIITDVGSVLVTQNQLKNMPAYANILVQSSDKIALLKAGYWCARHFTELRNINLTGPEDRVIDLIALNHPILNEPLNKSTQADIKIADYLKEIMCRGSSILETQKIFSDLIEHGYTVAIASNKGCKTIDRFMKTGTLLPLNYAFIFTCDSHQQAQNEIFYKKPSAEYFNELKKMVIQKGFEDYSPLFIDNDMANVLAACQAGMIGIHYTSPQQLIADLKELGITL